MNPAPSTARDCRTSYCSPPQTVRELLKHKRRSSQASPPLPEFTQDTGSSSSVSFLLHPHGQQDAAPLYSRPAAQYPYAPLEGFYTPPGSGPLYAQDKGYERARTEAQSLAANLGEVPLAPGSFMAPFTHDPSWLGLHQDSESESLLRMTTYVVPDLIPMDLDEARAKTHHLSPEQLLQRDEDGDTILHLYAAKGLRGLSYAVAERYQQYGQLDTKEHNGKSPLLVAVAANQPQIVYDLITLGADVDASDKKGQTALHVAGTYGLSDVLRVFVSLQLQKTFNVEARNYEGLTPLHCAVNAQNAAYTSRMTQASPENEQRERETQTCVQLLLQLGASCTSQDIKSNKTVLHLAVQAGNIPLVKFLLDLSLPDLPGLVNMKAHGNTVLHMAAALPPLQSTEYLIQLLLLSGADPSTRNLENEQPAHLVPPGDYSEQIKLLLKRRRVISSIRQQSSSSL